VPSFTRLSWVSVPSASIRHLYAAICGVLSMRPNSAIACTNCVGLAPTRSVRMIPVAGTLPKRRKASLTQVSVRLLLKPQQLLFPTDSS